MAGAPAAPSCVTGLEPRGCACEGAEGEGIWAVLGDICRVGQEDGAGLRSVVLSTRTRGTGHRPEPMGFCMDIRKNSMLWGWQSPGTEPREVEESPFLHGSKPPACFVCSCCGELLWEGRTEGISGVFLASAIQWFFVVSSHKQIYWGRANETGNRSS